MSFWSNLFSKNGYHTNGSTVLESDQPNGKETEIPENIFVEKSVPIPETKKEENKPIVRQDNLQSLYDFLSRDYQQMGYDDALMNPDTANRDANILSILSDLDIIIRRVKTFYEDALKELDFLIDSRSRLGMIDTVDELKMRKSKAIDHYEKTKEMQEEAKRQLGSSQRMIISYKRGFQNGMAAIAHHESNKYQF